MYPNLHSSPRGIPLPKLANLRRPDRLASPSPSKRRGRGMARYQRLGAAPGVGWRFAGLMAHMLINGLRRFWYICSAGILFLFLLYLLNGGPIVIVLLIFAFAGMLYNAGDALLFYPESPPTARLFVDSPASFGLPFENAFVRSVDGVRLHLVFVKQRDLLLPLCPTVVYFHGNAGNVGHRLANVAALHRRFGCNVLLVEYRGYGKSEGRPGETGFYRDARTAMEYLRRRGDVDKRQIVVFGRSLGGAMATYLASDPSYSDLIRFAVVENSFTNIPEVARVLFDFSPIRLLPDFVFKNQFPNDVHSRKIRVPVLFLSGSDDALIPSWMMRKLHEICSSPFKRFVSFESGGHNDTWQSPGYYEAWNDFAGEVAQFYANRESAAAASPASSAAPDAAAAAATTSSDLKASESFTLLMPRPTDDIFEPH